jgi:hypothetical protein
MRLGYSVINIDNVIDKTLDIDLVPVLLAIMGQAKTL